MGLDKLVIGQVNSATKNAFKMQLGVEGLKDKIIDEVSSKIEEQIPFPLPFGISTAAVLKEEQQLPDPQFLFTKEALLQQFPPYSTGAKALKSLSIPQKIQINGFLDVIEDNVNLVITQKNTIQGALNTILGPLTTIQKLVSTLNNILPILRGVITIVENIPLPASVPPGVGVPLNVINKFPITSAKLKKNIDKLQGPIDGADTGIKEVQRQVKPILDLISGLDPVFQKITQIIVLIRILLRFGDDLESLTPEKANEVVDEVVGRQTASQSTNPGPFASENDAENALANKALEESLTPGSPNPLIYKGFKLELQYDPNNTYSFPSRRIYGKFQNAIIENSLGLSNTQNAGFFVDERLLKSLKDAEIYNLPAITVTDSNDVRITEESQGHPYSFSSTTQVLLSEVYYEIDQLISGNESIIDSQNKKIISDAGGKAIGIVFGASAESLVGTPGFNIYYVLEKLGLYSDPTIASSSLPPSSNGLIANTANTNFVIDKNTLPLPDVTKTKLSNNKGLVFPEYVKYAIDKNIVRDAKGGQVGTIQGEYGVVLKFGGSLGRSTSDVTPRTQDYHNDIKGIFGDQAQLYVTNRGGTVFQSYKDANPTGTGKVLGNVQINSQGGGLLSAGSLKPVVYYPFGIAGSPGEVRRNTDGSYFRFYSANPDPSYANTALFLSASGILGATNSNSQLSASDGWFSITPPPTTPFNSYGSTPGEIRRNIEQFNGASVSNAYRWNNTTYIWEDNFTGTSLIGGSNATYFPDPFIRVGNNIGEVAYKSIMQLSTGGQYVNQKIFKYVWEKVGGQSYIINGQQTSTIPESLKWVNKGTSWTQSGLIGTRPPRYGGFVRNSASEFWRPGLSATAYYDRSKKYFDIVPTLPNGQLPLIAESFEIYP